jgi:hypothetical protein
MLARRLEGTAHIIAGLIGWPSLVQSRDDQGQCARSTRLANNVAEIFRAIVGHVTWNSWRRGRCRPTHIRDSGTVISPVRPGRYLAVLLHDARAMRRGRRLPRLLFQCTNPEQRSSAAAFTEASANMICERSPAAKLPSKDEARRIAAISQSCQSF